MKKNMLMSAAKKARVLLAVMAVCGMSFVGAGEAWAADGIDLPSGNNTVSEGAIGVGFRNEVTGGLSSAFGKDNKVYGASSNAMGSLNQIFDDAELGTAVGDSNKLWGKESTALGCSNEAKADNDTVVGRDCHAYGNSSVALGSSNYVYGYEGIAIGNNCEVGESGKAVNNAVAIGNYAKATEENTVSFGVSSDGWQKNYNKRLVNLANARDRQDAATWGQVQDLVASSGGGSVDLTGLNEDLKPVDGSDATVVSALNTVDDKANANAENIEKNKNAIQQNKDAIDNNSTAIQKNTTDIAANKEAIDNNSTAIEKNTTDIAANKEAIAKISTASQSVGDIADLDSDIKADTTVGAINNVNSKVDMLGNRVDKLDSKINKVGAGAAALAALHPMDFDPDNKLTFSAGVGNYHGENAMAVGAFYRPDEKVMFSIAGNMGNGENMINAGVTFALDRTHSTTTSKAAMAKKIEEQANDIAQLKAMVAELSAKVK